MKHIRDSLYGYITLSSEELEVLDSEEVQRLRRIQQLGLSSLIYPGASHTRFSHSLGVMHLAGEIGESIGLDEEKIEEFRLAGLLHDTGHGPFSHASERVAEKRGTNHEDISCSIVDELERRGILQKDPNKIKNHITGDSNINIINGPVDVDRMDYLRRDAYQTGLEHGTIDTNSIIKYAELDEENKLIFDKKSMQALERLLTARFHMRRSVYKHHTSLIAESMLERAIESYLENNNCSIDEIMSLDDYQMDEKLRNSNGEENKLYSAIRSRNLYKRCFPNTNLTKGQLMSIVESLPKNPRDIEKVLAQKCEIQPTSIIVDLPSLPSDVNPEVNIRMNGKIQKLHDVSPVPEQLEKSAWRNTTLGIYTQQSEVKNVREKASIYIREETGIDELHK